MTTNLNTLIDLDTLRALSTRVDDVNNNGVFDAGDEIVGYALSEKRCPHGDCSYHFKRGQTLTLSENDLTSQKTLEAFLTSALARRVMFYKVKLSFGETTLMAVSDQADPKELSDRNAEKLVHISYNSPSALVRIHYDSYLTGEYSYPETLKTKDLTLLAPRFDETFLRLGYARPSEMCQDLAQTLAETVFRTDVATPPVSSFSLSVWRIFFGHCITGAHERH